MISPVGGAETQDKQRPGRAISSHQTLFTHKGCGNVAKFIFFLKVNFQNFATYKNSISRDTKALFGFHRNPARWPADTQKAGWLEATRLESNFLQLALLLSDVELSGLSGGY